MVKPFTIDQKMFTIDLSIVWCIRCLPFSGVDRGNVLSEAYTGQAKTSSTTEQVAQMAYRLLSYGQGLGVTPELVM